MTGKSKKAQWCQKIPLKNILFIFVILVTASSLPVVAEPSPTAQLSDLQEERTTSAPKLEPTSSSIIRANDVAALTAIANLVTNTGEIYKTDVIALKISYIGKMQRQNLEPTSSSIIRASDAAALTTIENLVTNTGDIYKTDVTALKISYIGKIQRQKQGGGRTL